MTDEELEKIEEVFWMFDTNNTGLVKPFDIVHAMEKGGYDKEKASLFRLFKSIDTPEYNEHGITFWTFMETLNWTYLGWDIESLKYQFDLFDTDQKGYLDTDQLIQVFQ